VNRNLRTVYTTEEGRIGGDTRQGKRRSKETSLPSDGIVRVGRQTKGRKGAGVSVIMGLDLPSEDLKALARELKAKCGSGGTVRDGAIEIQGDHRDRLVELLSARGWTVRRAGGGDAETSDLQPIWGVNRSPKWPRGHFFRARRRVALFSGLQPTNSPMSIKYIWRPKPSCAESTVTLLPSGLSRG